MEAHSFWRDGSMTGTGLAVRKLGKGFSNLRGGFRVAKDRFGPDVEA